MKKENFDKKATEMRGKGGAILSFSRRGSFFNLLVFVLIFSFASQPIAFAGRSSAGGGDLEEVHIGRVLTNAAISIGAMAVGSAISSGMQSAAPASTLPKSAPAIEKIGTGVNSSLKTTGNLLTNTAGKAGGATPLQAVGKSLIDSASMANMVKGYNTFVATSQVGMAASSAGSYLGWKPSTTYMVATVATAAAGGFLNPDLALGDAMPKVTVNNQCQLC